MKLVLRTSQPVDNVTEIVIAKFPFVIGRRSNSNCALPLAYISRYHCQFLLNGGQVLVQDLESHNGTFVNGRLASVPTPLEHGDEVSLGPVSFRVVLSSLALETAEAFHLGPTREATALLAPESHSGK